MGIEVYVPKRKQFDPLDPENSFNNKLVYPTAVFGIQQEIDEKYILVPLKFAKEILDYTDEVSAIEINLKPGTNEESTIHQIRNLTGDKYIVQSRAEQHASLFKLMKIEKWVAFLILAFILLIVSFNLVGSLLMIVIEKKKDFSIMDAMGMPLKRIRNIILGEGFLITLIGSVTGIILGILACLVQKKFGFVKLGGSGGTFVIDAYPVELINSDIMITLLVAVGIGITASLYPSKTSMKIDSIRGE